MLSTLAVYVHHFDPFAIHFSEPGWLPTWLRWLVPAGIRWYGLSYLWGFILAYVLFRRVAKVGVTTVKAYEVGDLIVTLAIGVVVGGRLGYAVFYDPDLITWIDIHHFPFWGVLAINRGGMASHGGMIGAIVAAWWYARRSRSPEWHRRYEVTPAKESKGGKRAVKGPEARPKIQPHSLPHLLDLAAFATPIGLFFGRIANFINGELYGRACPDNSRLAGLAVKFPQEMLNWLQPGPDHLEFSEAQRRLTQAAHAMGYTDPIIDKATALTFIEHALQQVQSSNAAAFEAVKPILTQRYPSQLFEAVLEGLVVSVVLAIVWLRPRKPLVLGGWFAITYAVMRIIGEQFRTPDAQIGYQIFGTTRGQLLSSLMLLAGVVMVVVASRRNVAPMGGWLKRK